MKSIGQKTEEIFGIYLQNMLLNFKLVICIRYDSNQIYVNFITEFHFYILKTRWNAAREYAV